MAFRFSAALRRIALVLALVLAAALVVLLRSTEWLASLGGTLEGERLERARTSPQFGGGRFRNPVPTGITTGSVPDMMRRQLFGNEQRSPRRPVQVVARSASDYATPPASGMRVTWIGWSTVLVEIDGRRVLTDPIWSERCSPSPLVGPRRFHPPPIALEQLPQIDVVVVSHDHYDHLDMPTIRALARRGTRFAIPLGMGAHLERWGVPASQFTELDWNQSAEIAGLRITATPARHFSGRNPLRKDGILWASWVVRGPRHRIYFSGDTGFSDAFRAIGAAHGPFDLTLIKIGAYDRAWPDIHVNPEQAVQAHLDLRGRRMLAVHWGTFNLGIHGWSEPPERLLAAARAAGAEVLIPRPGELIDLAAPPPTVPWWR